MGRFITTPKFWCFSDYKITSYEAAFRNRISKLTVHKVSSAQVGANIRCVANNILGKGETSLRIEGKCYLFYKTSCKIDSKCYLFYKICWNLYY